MAIKNTLRARLELLGGKKIVEDFEKFGESAKKAFDRIDREAKKATRDVKELEKELKALDRISRDIRANIKVDKDGNLSKEQKAALAFADQIDNRIATIRKQSQGMEDSLALGGGNALKAISQSADKDLLQVQQSVGEIDNALEHVRKSGGFGGLISDQQLDDLKIAAARLQAGDDRLFANLPDRVAKAEVADEEAYERAIKRSQRAIKKKNEAIGKETEATWDLKEAQDAAADDKLRADKKARQSEIDLDRREADTERRSTEALSDAKDQASRKDEAAGKRRRKWAESDAITEERRIQQEAAAKERAHQRTLQHLKDQSALAEKLSRRSGLSGQNRAFAIRNLLDDNAIRELEKLQAHLSPLENGLGKAGNAIKAFDGAGIRLGKTLGTIGKGFGDTLGNVGKFVKAIESLGQALGNVALRTGVATLLGGLAVGLAGLGGAAALGGIAAIGALAAFDITKLKNAADAVGQSIETFSKLRYAASANGVNFDDYNKGLTAMQTIMSGIAKGKDEFKDAAQIFKQFGISVFAAGGKGFADAIDVTRQIQQVFQNLPNSDIKGLFLEALGGPAAGDLSLLFPLFDLTQDEFDRLLDKARELGLEVTEQQAAEMKKLRLQFIDMWEGLKGTAYKIAAEIMPQMMPVLDKINAWIVANQGKISQYLIDTFDYLVKVVVDLWKLFSEGAGAETQIGWTHTFYRAVMEVIGAFQTLWKVIATGYKAAEEPLRWLGEKLGTGGPLQTAIVLLSGWILGFFTLFASGARMAIAALGVVASAFRGLLWPAIQLILGGIGSILGWPALVVAGVGLVATYWDDIGRLFTMAWQKFKQTFPETAKYLEDAFGPALTTVKNFTSNMLKEFQAKYPRLTQLLLGVKDAARDAWAWAEQFDWSGMFKGLSDASLRMLDWLATLLDRLAPALQWVAKAIGFVIDANVQAIKAGWDVAAPAVNYVVEANADAIMGGAEVIGGWFDPTLSAMPESAANASNAEAYETGGGVSGPTSVINLNLGNGDVIETQTRESNIPNRILSSSSAAQISSAPAWNR
ncbi:hypothetical protein [Rhizobium leguminosarum]|uniref:hypothetical protein n=1 Tax=Rhizobium leguminosarum TaxID=384 RepID=UPI0014421E08|nr:hypothetical protein [Rhizobium leguminosarum]NKJ77762.1 hypothetical protein [Rhizobium leguminosarum bv. viciae]